MICALRFAAVFAVLLLPQLARATPIATYYQTTDGDDWSSAIHRAQAQGAVQLELEAKAYNLAKTVEICRPLRIVGQGIGAALASSSFRIARKTAFRAWFKNHGCPIAGLTAGNGALAMEHVVVFNTGGLSLEGEEPFYGLDARTAPRLHDVWFRGFVQGIRMVCDAASSGTNCNTFSITHSGTDQNEHAGIYLQGGDVNAGHLFDVSVISSCSKATKWKHLTHAWCAKYATHPICTDPHLQCAGFLDLSFLGNTYLACSAASMNGKAGYAFGGANQTNAAIGIYAENDTMPQWADGRSNVVGGTNTFSGSAGQWHGDVMPSLRLVYWDIEYKLGAAAGQGVVWSLSTAATRTWPWRYKVDAPGNMFLDVGNLPPLRGYLPYDPTKVAP